MTGRPRVPPLAAALCLLAALAGGCQRNDQRTSRGLLSRESAGAFDRAYQARHRMATGDFDEEILASVGSRCDEVDVNSPGERRWRWRCRVSYRARTGDAGVVDYAVSVNPDGCFTATSAAQPSLAWERVLGRLSPNPLARFHSCP